MCVSSKPNALVIDFFAGSGTTLHAINLLNAEDGGKRRCIMVTNNEVSADESEELTAQGYQPGDCEWENLGIARHVTWPRTVCSIKGNNIEGSPLTGTYGCDVEQYIEIEGEVTDSETGKRIRGKVYKKVKLPAYPNLADLKMSDGFKTNAAYFKLSFLDKTSVALGRQFKELLPVLWMKGGAIGKCPMVDEGDLPNMLILPMNKMAILIDEIYYTVKDIVEALQNSEGGEIPADIVGESTAGKKFDTLTVKSGKKGKSTPCPGQLTLDGLLHNPTQSDLNQVANPVSTETSDRPDSTMRVEPAIQNPKQELQKSNQAQPVSDAENQPNSETHIGNVTSFDSPSVTDNVPATMEGHASSASEPPTDLFDREAVMKFINDSGLLSYNVRSLRINNYLKSLYKMAHLLTMSRLRREAIREVQSEIADMIHTYVQDLKAKEKYEDLVLQVKQFKLATQIFDAFGETVDNYSVHDLFTTTDTDIDRQFRIADVKLGNEGIGMFYGNKYMDDADPSGFKVDVILFAADGECMIKLYQYAETRFHRMNDDYRRYFATITSEDIRRQYDRVVSDGDVVSKHNFRLPETIQVPHESGGKEYRDHLFVSEETGFAKLKLNPWESGVLKEEQGRKDFVCWIRNPSRGSWALCIPYEMDGETKPTYPDIIIVRTDKVLGYVIDILEPHNPAYKDNLGKAKGFAEYARQNPGVGRIQLIRMSEDAAKNKRFKRLDMSKSAIRDKVSHAMSNDELDHIFDTDGFFADSIED